MSILDTLRELNVALPDDVDVEKVYKELSDQWKLMPASEKEQAELAIRSASAASEFNEQGFMDFYWCLWKRNAPPYARQWVRTFMSGKWTILYCFRGSTKSTTLTITFSLFWLLHRPYSSVMIVQANDSSASRSTALISDIIEHYKGWSACAPNIVPDKEKGWGANGYFIKDSSLDYSKWLEKCQQDHLRDPSFVGLGIMSGEIVGMHPSLLLFDDIHDRKNSAFPKDRQSVVETVRANVLPTITRASHDGHKSFIGVSCTFWDEQDAYHALLETGLFQYIETPIMKFDENGKDEFEGKNVTLTWPEGFSMAEIKQLRQTNSSREFARMYLCDLSSRAVSNYPTWITVEPEDIDWKWPMICGADPVNAYRAVAGQEGDRSHFALAYGLRTTTGAVVIGDGVMVHCTPYEAEQYIMRAQMTYPGYQTTVIETHGGGSVFISFMQRNPDLRILPADQLPKLKGSKSVRQYELLEPLLRTGALQVSGGNSPFLTTLRNYFDRYPNFEEHAPEWDVADSVYYMVLGFPDIAMRTGLNDTQKKIKRSNPWAHIGD